MTRATCALFVLAACAGADVAPPQAPVSVSPPPAVSVPDDAALVSTLASDAAPDAEPDAMPASDEVWLKGSTHVHARPSGDSSEPVPDVVAWYADCGYDFIALTDYNRVTDVAGDTRGLIVLPGIELTFNPSGCLPQGHPSKKCRIHVNALGVTARPAGKLEWADRHTHERLAMYQAALTEANALGARVIQINHPQWYWGMNPDLLVELAQRGAHLVEIANVQFATWNAGDKDHPSTEALWDAALSRGAVLWGIASDDAHSYEHPGRWPAGGGWVVVKARRDPAAILDALAAGHFYASTGVVLDQAGAEAGALVVAVAAGQPGTYAIDFIENGQRVEHVAAPTARRALPSSGYVRAVVTRDDGKQAWVQPVRP